MSWQTFKINPILHKHLWKEPFLSTSAERTHFYSPPKFSPSSFMKDGFELFFLIATAPPFSKKIIYFKPQLSKPYMRLGELSQVEKRFKGRYKIFLSPLCIWTFYRFCLIIRSMICLPSILTLPGQTISPASYLYTHSFYLPLLVLHVL